MATVFTHAIVGASLATLAPRGVRPLPLAAGLAGLSVLPDADVAGFAAGIPYGHPLGHRGLTHSLPFAAVVGLLVPWLVARAHRERRFTVAERARLWALGFVALASHGLLDALTDGGRGVGFLVPLSQERFFLPWRPLRVSPIGVEAFFSGRVAAILRAELRVVVLPVAVAAAAVLLARRRARRGDRLPA